MFEKFRRWLKGEFKCRKCGELQYHAGMFGFGECLCPNCHGEHVFLWLDGEYWLNRLVFSMTKSQHVALIMRVK